VSAPSHWIAETKKLGVLFVAEHAQFDVSIAKNWIAPCPACGACTRHTKSNDQRGAVGSRPDGQGWKCFQCEASGDAVDLIAYAVGGTRFRNLNTSHKVEVRARCEALHRELAKANRDTCTRAASAAPRARPYPPLADIQEVWDGAVPVVAVPEVADALQERRISPNDVAERDLARALTRVGRQLPDWARHGTHSWRNSGHLWVSQLFDAEGRFRSLIARSVHLPVLHGPKSLAPAGFARTGLILACPEVRRYLETADSAFASDFKLVVCEGEKKWLQHVLAAGGQTPARVGVIGIENGSWSPSLAARIPTGTTLLVRTDPDTTGASYATKILLALRDRVARKEVAVALHPGLRLAKYGDHGLRVEVRR
jgi:hypothetical protein